MATLKTIAPVHTAFTTQAEPYIHTSFREKLTNFADGQESNHTLWFFITLLVHGVFFLPLPAVLMYYFDAPAAVLAITMICFFTNLIANMGGAGIRATLAFFFASVAIHVLMAVLVIL
jgi:hypothetical protein